MHCSYYSKAGILKRLIGIRGYCSFHGKYIKACTKISYYPYIYCKGINGECFDQCGVEICIKGKDKKG